MIDFVSRTSKDHKKPWAGHQKELYSNSRVIHIKDIWPHCIFSTKIDAYIPTYNGLIMAHPHLSIGAALD